MEIIIKKGSLLNEQVDAIVNPANSYGFMGGGVAKVIKEVGGKDIEEEAIHLCPTPLGSACLTKAGHLPANYVIHAPTMTEPVEHTDSTKVQQAVEAALELAEEHKFKSIAFPGMGTGIGGLSNDETAEVMITTLKNFEAKSLQKVVLKAIDDELFDAWTSRNT